jgi:hypothetical protein
VTDLPEPIAPPSGPARPAGEPRQVLTPALLRAGVSPTAVAVTAAGAGIGILDHSVILSVVLAAGAWMGRMAIALGARRREARAARPRPAVLDPWSVPEPWRQLLRQASGAQTRFDRAVSGWPDGPTRDRLVSLQLRVYTEVGRLGALARQGAATAGWSGTSTAAGQPAVEDLAAELRRTQADLARVGPEATERRRALARREAAIAAQLRSRRHAEDAAEMLHDRLRSAVARLDQSVTDLLVAEPAGSESALDELTDGISSLGAALAEGGGPPPPDRATP